MSSNDFDWSDRDSQSEVMARFEEFKDHEEIKSLLNALPYIAALLNKHRQIVFCNNVLLSEIGQERFESVIGYRPGEVLKCGKAKNNTGGCGTSSDCEYCGAFKSITECQKNKIKTTYDCLIATDSEKENNSLELNVTSSPFVFGNVDFTLLTIVDISDQNRRKALERIFFHDIINKVGNLNGLFELIQDVNRKERAAEFLDIAVGLSKDITEEILSQRELLAAENGELKINIKNVSLRYLVSQAAKQIQNHDVAKNKIVKLEPNSEDYFIDTDPSLIKRVVTNMLKNAMEAVSRNEMVTIGYESVKNGVSIYVKNNTVMSDEVKSHMFKRSFSTKGSDRGIGTYSMKLLGEKYLKGKVGFQSENTTGTVFYINVPLNQSLIV